MRLQPLKRPVHMSRAGGEGGGRRGRGPFVISGLVLAYPRSPTPSHLCTHALIKSRLAWILGLLRPSARRVALHGVHAS